MGPILEDPETPSKPAKKPVKKAEPPAAPVTPSLRSQGSGGVRRRLGERPAPRQSRLSTEVFSAADADSDEEEGGEEMEVDS
jgi:hypothetical protein